MTDSPAGHDHTDDSAEGDEERVLTRRRFVAAGVAVGAAVVWVSPFPFADAAIGQVIRSNTGNNPTGPTGPTGSSGSTGSTSSTGSTGSTATTGTTGTSGSGAPTGEAVNAGLGHITDVATKAGSVSFTQEIVEAGAAHWWVFLRVPHDHSFITIQIGKAHHLIVEAGEHRIKVSFSGKGKREAERHRHASLVIDTSFVDDLGRRFAKSHVVER